MLEKKIGQYLLRVRAFSTNLIRRFSRYEAEPYCSPCFGSFSGMWTGLASYTGISILGTWCRGAPTLTTVE